MALCRCLKFHGERPIGKYGRQYDGYVKPVGYRNPAVICGGNKPDGSPCIEPGVLWLDHDEAESYNRGERLFKTPDHRNSLKIKADDSGVTTYR